MCLVAKLTVFWIIVGSPQRSERVLALRRILLRTLGEGVFQTNSFRGRHRAIGILVGVLTE